MAPELKNIDLHMHSNVSDGTDSPKELLALVKEKKISLFSLTDHDALNGAMEIQNHLDQFPEPLLFLRGVELSCQDARGKYHILGYQYDRKGGPLHQMVQKAHDIRLEKVTARLDFLKREFGFSFREEDVRALFQNHNPGKPHIAKMMVTYGYAESVSDAMKRFLNKKKFPNVALPPEKAIGSIIDSGGTAILAHPAYGDGDQLILGEDMDQRIRYLMDFGLQGMECYYSSFTPRIIEEMLDLAGKYQLFVTAGSDYHGSNKLVCLGDTNLPAPQDRAPGFHAFLKAVQVI
ncbi:MAG: PHP domain-containing protein [Parasporobacterium sp.]|nr:PHP domain-containing protein [Parasporobacterium sp.]